jgi:D-xylose transport system substrate-binding protein
MTIHPRTFAVAGVALAMAAGVAACGSDNGGGTASQGTAKPHKDLTIAFLMPCSTCADRFEMQDKPSFEAAVQRLAPGAKVIADNAEGDGARQISQTESALTNGADVIVVSPLDESTGAAIAAKTTQAHVPVVSYDGLLTDGKIDAFVSFDNTKVGEMQGKYLADHLKPGSTVAFINGDQSIAPGRQFRAGAHEALDPLFKSGKLKLGYEADAQQFDPQKARTLTEQALTRLNDKVDGVVAANDGIAGGVADALQPQKLTGKVLVTGQDASDAGLQRILLGEQTMSVYKAIKAEADVAAQLAIALGDGDTAKARSLTKTTVDNGAGRVPSVLLDPVVVTKDNIAGTVIKDGFTSKAKICTGKAAARCPA